MLENRRDLYSMDGLQWVSEFLIFFFLGRGATAFRFRKESITQKRLRKSAVETFP